MTTEAGIAGGGAAASAAGTGKMGLFSGGAAGFVAALQPLVDAFRAMILDALEAPSRIGQARDLYSSNGDHGSIGHLLLWVFATLGGALAVALIVRAATQSLRSWLKTAEAESFDRRLVLCLIALVVDAAPPLTFLAAGHVLEHAMFGPSAMAFGATDVYRAVLQAILLDVGVGWLAVTLLALPVGAGRPGLRLLPIDESEARGVRRAIRRITVVAIGGWLLAEILFLTWFGDGLPRLIVIVMAAVVGVLCLRGLNQIRARATGVQRLWYWIAVIGVVGLWVTWTVRLLHDVAAPFSQVLATMGILAAMPAIDLILNQALKRLRIRLEQHRPTSRRIFIPGEEGEALHAIEQPAEPMNAMAASAELSRAIEAFNGVLHDMVCLAVALAAVVLLTAAWSIDPVDVLGMSDGRTLLGRAADAGTMLVIGWYAWRLFETGLAVRLAREPGGVQSRAQTVQPLLRSVGRIIIGAISLMGALSALGLNIAPLLASAGVIGIAVGFGAQTLVRDIFSGAFYLIEDAFRIGDYIEAGSAKGTVEQITFRTVALRHQNGPLHFVSYGTLGSVRNNSRDWVIDKFEIPLPSSVDSERIRKMVKKIGQEMLEDPDLARVILAPLKTKLYRIDPGIKVFRCKVQTPPGEQFTVRSESYRRIEAALRDAGIPFADRGTNVTVNNALAAPADPLSTGRPLSVS